MNRILALDPGVTTGVALYDPGTLQPGQQQSAMIRSWQIGPEDHHQTLWRCLTGTALDLVVYERFVYQRRDKVILTSVEYIGVVKLFSQLRGTPTLPQTPSQAMNLWTDDKLKKVGLYKAGMPHAMDAVRHILYHLVVTKNDHSWLEPLRPSADAV